MDGQLKDTFAATLNFKDFRGANKHLKSNRPNSGGFFHAALDTRAPSTRHFWCCDRSPQISSWNFWIQNVGCSLQETRRRQEAETDMQTDTQMGTDGQRQTPTHTDRVGQGNV